MRLSAVAGVLFYVSMLTVHTHASAAAGGAGAERDPRRDRHALFPGPDGAGGRGTTLYTNHPRRLDHRRFYWRG